MYARTALFALLSLSAVFGASRAMAGANTATDAANYMNCRRDVCAAGSKEAVLYSFQGAPDGQQPMGSLIADKHGNLIGVTNIGGTGSCRSTDGAGCGTVFMLSPQGPGQWTESVIYSFQGGGDGQNPWQAPVFDEAGNLYGVTAEGGTGNCTNMNLSGCGTVFELSPQGNGSWTESVLYSFQGVPAGNGNGDAALPNSLVFDRSGNLFGFSSEGGSCSQKDRLAFCDGAAFEIERKHGSWREKIIYRPDGATAVPAGALFDSTGNLYGVSPLGGSGGVGDVFELTPPSGKAQWAASVIYTFQNGPDGAIPVPGLLFDPQGNLFGASAGSDSVAANVFELTPGANNSWTESVLFGFNDGSIYPPRGPIMDGHGNLFGTTEFGGPAQSGNVYKGSQKGGRWTMRDLHDFGSGADGSEPLGGLVFGKGGALYGTTVSGGTGICRTGCGAVFRIKP